MVTTTRVPRKNRENLIMSTSSEPNGSTCSTCGAPIDWRKTNANKWTPIDAGTHTPHWSTCPTAELHRKKQQPKLQADIPWDNL